jgi:hypothetical protein
VSFLEISGVAELEIVFVLIGVLAAVIIVSAAAEIYRRWF